MKRLSIFVLSIVLIVILAACGNNETKESPVDEDKEVNGIQSQEENGETLVNVILKDQEGRAVGSAVLTEEDAGVQIALEATNLSEGKHGFHIHENGVCEEPSFESAGGHLNFEDTSHGFDHGDGPHVGDLPNLEVAEDGTVKAEVVNEMVTLVKEAPNTLLTEGGTTLIIHADADDGKSQPAGDAGERIVCGVIGE